MVYLFLITSVLCTHFCPHTVGGKIRRSGVEEERRVCAEREGVQSKGEEGEVWEMCSTVSLNSSSSVLSSSQLCFLCHSIP